MISAKRTIVTRSPQAEALPGHQAQVERARQHDKGDEQRADHGLPAKAVFVRRFLLLAALSSNSASTCSEFS